MSRQFRSDDTDKWLDEYGMATDGNTTVASNATDSVIDSSCSASISSTSLSATNGSFVAGQIILIHKSRGNTTTAAGNWELNKISAYVAGTITLKYPTQFAYNDSGNDQSQVLVLEQNNNFNVNSGVTLTGKSWDGNVGGILGILAKDTVTIDGALSVNGSNGYGGSGAYNNRVTGGGFWGGRAKAPTGGNVGGQAEQGEGSAAAQSYSNAANGNGGGGAYVANAGSSQAGGGAGGNGIAGGTGVSRNSATGGQGGSAVGNAGLTIMLFGGGGGGAGSDGGATCGNGGSGAGIIIIIAKKIIINGYIYLVGGNGGSDYAGGGPGAGGSCLLKGQSINIGTNKINVAGGVRGDGNNDPGYSVDGGTPAYGRIHVDYSKEIIGSTTSPSVDSRLDSYLADKVGGIILQRFIDESDLYC